MASPGSEHFAFENALQVMRRHGLPLASAQAQFTCAVNAGAGVLKAICSKLQREEKGGAVQV
ncbi:hypothetical protein V6C53_15305 [Desulfocurvibacter africanus]|uniref:hypothetical protein n=1 Tax=Desulfocurvibacter africanus TaxID=873 RepID=UPI002FDB9347